MTESDPPPVLNYVPQRYRHRQSKALGLAVWTILAALVMAGCDWRGVGPPWWGQALIVGVPGVLAVSAYVFRWAAECRIEEDSLWFAMQNVRPVSVPIDDIIAIDRVETGDTRCFEIVVRGKGRMRVSAEVFEPIEPLKQALRAVNPGIRFGSQSAGHCRSCGAELFPPGRVPSIPQAVRLVLRKNCPACDQPLPRFGEFV